jgi:hypothetical protein
VLTVQPGEEKRITFSVAVDKDNTAIQLDGPVVTVNDLIVYAHPVLLGRQMTDAQWESVKEIAYRCGQHKVESYMQCSLECENHTQSPA